MLKRYSGFDFMSELIINVKNLFFLGDIFSLFDMEQLTPNTVTQLLHNFWEQ